MGFRFECSFFRAVAACCTHPTFFSYLALAPVSTMHAVSACMRLKMVCEITENKSSLGYAPSRNALSIKIRSVCMKHPVDHVPQCATYVSSSTMVSPALTRIWIMMIDKDTTPWHFRTAYMVFRHHPLTIKALGFTNNFLLPPSMHRNSFPRGPCQKRAHLMNMCQSCNDDDACDVKQKNQTPAALVGARFCRGFTFIRNGG